MALAWLRFFIWCGWSDFRGIQVEVSLQEAGVGDKAGCPWLGCFKRVASLS